MTSKPPPATPEVPSAPERSKSLSHVEQLKARILSSGILSSGNGINDLPRETRAKATFTYSQAAGESALDSVRMACRAGDVKVKRDGTMTADNKRVLEAILDVTQKSLDRKLAQLAHLVPATASPRLRQRGAPLARSRQHRAAPARTRGSRRSRTVSSNSNSGDSDPGGEPEPPRGFYRVVLSFLALVLSNGGQS